LPGYKPSPVVKRYPTAFRGTTIIKAYLQDEPLDFSFLVQDVNRHEGADVLNVTASLDGAEVAHVESADDENGSADGKLSQPHTVHIGSKGPLTGTVRIELAAGDDIVVRETQTAQQKFVFVNRFYSADAVGYAPAPLPFSLVTNGPRILATTAHPESFQTLTVGSKQLVVDDVNKRFSVSAADEVRQQGSVVVSSPRGDLRLETSGYFAFSSDNFWTPDPMPLTWEADVDKDGIDYILTSYVPPMQLGGVKLAEAEFDMSKLSIDGRTATFTVSVPGIEFQNKELKILGIDVELRKKPLNVADLFHYLWK